MENLQIEKKRIELFSEYLIKELDCEYFFICKIEDYTNSKPIISFNKLNQIDNVPYEMDVTPCFITAQTGTGYYPKNVQNTFPLDKFFVEYGINSYIGIALFKDNQVRPCGIMITLFKDNHENGEEVLKKLRIKADEAARFIS